MRRSILALAILTLAAPLLAAADLTFRLGDRSVTVPTTPTGRVQLAPVARLLGAGIHFSPSAGTWAVNLGEHEIQLSAGSRYALVDGALKRFDEAPVQGEGGIELAPELLEAVVLDPLGYHLERTSGGYRIVPGPRHRAPVAVVPVAADFGRTTTVVLTLDRDVPVEVEEVGGAVEVRFADARPQVDTSRRLESARVRGLVARGGSLHLLLAEGTRLVAWHRLENPPRVALDLGERPRAVPSPPPSNRPAARPVVLDPGHGGADAGARSASGLLEKDLTLDVARRVRRLLEARGIPVRLTRESDADRALTDRTAMANRLRARVFVSLHANASPVASVRGAETYYMSLDREGTDARATATAALENRPAGGGGRSGVDLVLWEMAQAKVLNESARLALALERRLDRNLGLPDRGVKQAPFVVLTGATMPAALVEMGFLTNPEESRRLADPAYRDRLARAIAGGILDYLGTR